MVVPGACGSAGAQARAGTPGDGFGIERAIGIRARMIGPGDIPGSKDRLGPRPARRANG